MVSCWTPARGPYPHFTCVYIHVYTHPQDLCSKLVVLTWEDWSPEVRQAAAQALGLSGHGKASRCYSHAIKTQKCNSEIPGTLCILHCCCSSSTMKSRGGLRVGLKLSALMLWRKLACKLLAHFYVSVNISHTPLPPLFPHTPPPSLTHLIPLLYTYKCTPSCTSLPAHSCTLWG